MYGPKKLPTPPLPKFTYASNFATRFTERKPDAVAGPKGDVYGPTPVSPRAAKFTYASGLGTRIAERALKGPKGDVYGPKPVPPRFFTYSTGADTRLEMRSKPVTTFVRVGGAWVLQGGL